jgi:peptide/nickel transport system permease protein
MSRSVSPSARIIAGLLGSLRAKVILAVLALFVLMALFAPWIAPLDPNAQTLSLRLKPPFWIEGSVPGHWLGTDQLGRDILSRIVHGSRVSILVGVAATLLAGLIGITIGLLAGFYAGWREQVLMRLADVQLAFPSILLALALVAAVGPSMQNLIVALGITGWVTYARVVRAEVLSLRNREYVVAARSFGVSDGPIIKRHLLPNVLAPVATIGTLQVAAMILSEASLSYLGLGVPPNIPSWGAMLRDGQLFLRSAWWLAVFPGLAVMILTLAISLLGDLLRDLTDPKSYGR